MTDYKSKAMALEFGKQPVKSSQLRDYDKIKSYSRLWIKLQEILKDYKINQKSQKRSDVTK